MKSMRDKTSVALKCLGAMAALSAAMVPDLLQACASCSSGDPTLTVMGTELPFAGRKRFSLETRYREDELGDPTLEGHSLQELRTELSLAWTPKAAWTLSASLPLLAREVTHVNLSTVRVLGPGDAEVRVRRLLWRDASFMPRHLLTLQVGLKMPTSPELEGLDMSAQLGSGSWDPSVTLAYACFAQPFSAYVSVRGVKPSLGYQQEQAGASLHTSWMAQWQPQERFSVRGGLDARFDWPTLEAGLPEPDSGGFITFAALDAVVSPVNDLLLRVGGAVPVYNALSGHHVESPLVTVGVTYDF